MMTQEEFERVYNSPERVAEREKEEAERKERHERLLSRAIGLAVVKCGMPERARFHASGTLEKTQALEAVQSGGLVVLSGSPGCGKTVAACKWIIDHIENRESWDQQPGSASFKHNHKPLWFSAARLARMDRYDDAQMREILTTKRLVIDDLGGEYLDKGGFYASLLDEIVNERQAASLDTVFTTNLDAEAFKARYGERIVDRIREGGKFVVCGTTSLRRKP